VVSRLAVSFACEKNLIFVAHLKTCSKSQILCEKQSPQHPHKAQLKKETNLYISSDVLGYHSEIKTIAVDCNHATFSQVGAFLWAVPWTEITRTYRELHSLGDYGQHQARDENAHSLQKHLLKKKYLFLQTKLIESSDHEDRKQALQISQT
jgi:hypothetical protein